MEKANKQKTALISNTSKNDQWLQSSKIDYFAKATVSQTGHQSSMCQKHLKKKKDLRITIQLFYAKTNSKKCLILKKNDRCLKSGKISHFSKAIVRQNVLSGTKTQCSKNFAKATISKKLFLGLKLDVHTTFKR